MTTRISKLAVAAAMLALAGCQTAVRPTYTVSNGGSKVTINKQLTTTSGNEVKVVFDTAINPDCSLVEVARPVLLQNAQHGEVKIFRAEDFPFFKEPNPRAACNSRRVSGYKVTYRSAPGFVGQDAFSFSMATTVGGIVENVITVNVQ